MYLKNFQAHSNSYLELHPGVNVITGENDKGKSCLVRFIRWMAMNRPLGDSIIRDEQTEVEGTMIVMNDGQEIPVTRIRNKSKNIYTIDFPKEATFEAFGSDPPEHIRSIFQLDDLNYQDQFDPYFLVTQSPGQVATFIRYHTDLEVIDKSIVMSTSKLREIKSQIVQNTAEEEKIQTVLNNLEKFQLDQFQKLLNHAIEDIALIELLSGKTQELSSLLIRQDQCEAQLAQYSPDIETNYEKATNLVVNFSKIQEQHNIVIETTNRLQQLEVSQIDLAELDELIKTVKEVQIFNTEYIEKKLKPLITIIGNWEQVCFLQRPIDAEEIFKLTDRIKAISIKATELPVTIRLVQRNIKNYDVLIKQLFDMNCNIEINEKTRDVLLSQVVSCPSCGQVLMEDGRDHLLKHLM